MEEGDEDVDGGQNAACSFAVDGKLLVPSQNAENRHVH